MKEGIVELILEFFLGAVVIMIVAHLFPEMYVKDFSTAFLIAAILAILNTFVKPILTFIAFPITLLSLGIFQLIINGFVLEIVQKILAPDFYIPSFFMTIVISLVISILYSLFGIGKIDE